MKKVIISSVMFMAVCLMSVSAQSPRGEEMRPMRNETMQNRQEMTPQQMMDKHMQQMTTDLQLTVDQQNRVKALMEKNVSEMSSFDRNQNRPTEEEMKVMKKQREDMQKNMKKEMKNILSDEQYKKWEDMQSRMPDRKDKDNKKR